MRDFSVASDLRRPSENGDFIPAGAVDHVRTFAQYKGSITGALRIAHLYMAIPNTSNYERLTAEETSVSDAIGCGVGHRIACQPIAVSKMCLEVWLAAALWSTLQRVT